MSLKFLHIYGETIKLKKQDNRRHKLERYWTKKMKWRNYQGQAKWSWKVSINQNFLFFYTWTNFKVIFYRVRHWAFGSKSSTHRKFWGSSLEFTYKSLNCSKKKKWPFRVRIFSKFHSNKTFGSMWFYLIK